MLEAETPVRGCQTANNAKTANKKKRRTTMPRNRSIQLSRRQLIKGTAAASATLLLGKPAIAKGKTEIVIGNIDAYSGPAAVYSSIGRTDRKSVV